MRLLIVAAFLVTLCNSQCHGDIKKYSVDWPGVTKKQYCITDCTKQRFIQPMSCVDNRIYACKLPDGDHSIAIPKFFTMAGNVRAASKADVVANMIILPVEKCKTREGGKPYTRAEYNHEARLYHELKDMIQNPKYLIYFDISINEPLTEGWNDPQDGLTLIAPNIDKQGKKHGQARAFMFVDDILKEQNDDIRTIRMKKAGKLQYVDLFEIPNRWHMLFIKGYPQFKELNKGDWKKIVPGRGFLGRRARYMRQRASKGLVSTKYIWCESFCKKDTEGNISQSDETKCKQCSENPDCRFFENVNVKKRTILYQNIPDRAAWEYVMDNFIQDTQSCKALEFYKEDMLIHNTLRSQIRYATEILNKQKVMIVTPKTLVMDILEKIGRLGYDMGDAHTVQVLKMLAAHDKARKLRIQKWKQGQIDDQIDDQNVNMFIMDSLFIMIIGVLICCFTIGSLFGVLVYRLKKDND